MWDGKDIGTSVESNKGANEGLFGDYEEGTSDKVIVGCCKGNSVLFVQKSNVTKCDGSDEGSRDRKHVVISVKSNEDAIADAFVGYNKSSMVRDLVGTFKGNEVGIVDEPNVGI